jgi:putative glycosyltransferase (TIGR04372 family)
MRNRSITDFVPMTLALAEQGIQVIRLGHLVGSELGVAHPLVFDYATSGKRTELLDLFIPLTATAAVSTLTGSDAVALVGRRPVLYVDIALYAQVFHSTRLTTWIPARIRDNSTGSLLTLSEVFARGIGWFVEPSEFTAASVEPVRSTPDEIANYATEYVQTILRGAAHNETQHNQDAARAEVAQAMGARGEAMHGEIRSRLLDSFLRKHGDFLQSTPLA